MPLIIYWKAICLFYSKPLLLLSAIMIIKKKGSKLFIKKTCKKVGQEWELFIILNCHVRVWSPNDKKDITAVYNDLEQLS